MLPYLDKVQHPSWGKNRIFIEVERKKKRFLWKNLGGKRDRESNMGGRPWNHGEKKQEEEMIEGVNTENLVYITSRLCSWVVFVWCCGHTQLHKYNNYKYTILLLVWEGQIGSLFASCPQQWPIHTCCSVIDCCLVLWDFKEELNGNILSVRLHPMVRNDLPLFLGFPLPFVLFIFIFSLWNKHKCPMPNV